LPGTFWKRSQNIIYSDETLGHFIFQMICGTHQCYEKYEPNISKSKENTMRITLNNPLHRKKIRDFKNLSGPAMIATYCKLH
jgi:hypothetical protein